MYEGEFQDDLFHGVGKLSYREGVEFEGIFHRGQHSNIGRINYAAAKKVYVGEVLDMKRHGVGMLTDLKLGKRYEGEFEEDEPTGLGRIVYDNGDVYLGEV